MSTKVKKPTNAAQATSTIYRQIIQAIDNLLEKVKSDSKPSTSSAVQELDDSKKNAYELLLNIRDEIVRNLEMLEKNADWNTFTMAFYGETNAGKSTIIETLRIMFDEPEKIKAQKKFRVLQKQLDIDQSSFDEIRKNILQLEKEVDKNQQYLNQLKQRKNQEMAKLSALLKTLEKQLKEKETSLNFFQKIMAMIRELPEKKEVLAQNIKITAQEIEFSEALVNIENSLYEYQDKHKALCAKHDEMLTRLGQLEPLADGGIIGDGRSDYTLDSQSYVMEQKGQHFALLDVPGIEGKEEKVGESIWQAVQKAHAVFYVTGKAAAPQTGDDNTKGTLEKIKEHLGDQTEVWSIFNKRITNPLQLQKPQLISSGEKESLRTLDEKMSEQLGENYQGSFSVCGLVGFLAAADCLVPGQENSKRKEKFMAKHDEPYLLSYSGMTDFKRVLSEEFVKGFKIKIKRANVNKANQALKKASSSIEHLQQDKFIPLYEKLLQEADAANHQLDAALDTLKSDLRALSGHSVDVFKSNVRKTMYEKISQDIDNDEFKDDLSLAIFHAQEKFDKEFPIDVESEIKSFGENVQAIVERFQQHADEVLELYSSFNTQGFSEWFSLDVDIDNGVNVMGLIGTVVGTVGLAFTPVGWGAIAVGAVGLVFSFYKSVRSFFSSDYKMSQQRKSTDDNLYNVARELERTVDRNIDDAIPNIESQLETLKKALKTPVVNTEAINDVLTESIGYLHKISNKIEKVI